ncbi:hypothetical protein BDW62DRAFT_200816 [Aspergillus aurantiobrunneus]
MATDDEGMNAFRLATLGSNPATSCKFILWSSDIDVSDRDGSTTLRHAVIDDWVVSERIKELCRLAPISTPRTRKEKLFKSQLQHSDLILSYGMFFNYVLDRHEISKGTYEYLPALVRTLMEKGANVMIRDDGSASALNIALPWYLK